MNEKQCYKKPWYEYQAEVRKALHTINWMFGKNQWHEHQKIVGYLEGWLAGAEFLDREIDASETNKGES